jgi:hypothetical protein
MPSGFFGLRWQAQRDTALLFCTSRAFAHKFDAQSTLRKNTAQKAPSSLRFAGAVQNTAT